VVGQILKDMHSWLYLSVNAKTSEFLMLNPYTREFLMLNPYTQKAIPRYSKGNSCVLRGEFPNT